MYIIGIIINHCENRTSKYNRCLVVVCTSLIIPQCCTFWCMYTSADRFVTPKKLYLHSACWESCPHCVGSTLQLRSGRIQQRAGDQLRRPNQSQVRTLGCERIHSIICRCDRCDNYRIDRTAISENCYKMVEELNSVPIVCCLNELLGNSCNCSL